MTDNARTATTRRRRANVQGGRVGDHRVKVSAEEEAALVKRASELGVTVPRLLVESALAENDGKTAVERRDELAELFHMRKLLASVSNNVNQIARAANAGQGIDAGLTHALATVERICGSLDEYINASVVAR